MSTYTGGFHVRCTSDVTRGQFIHMCEIIAAKLNTSRTADAAGVSDAAGITSAVGGEAMVVDRIGLTPEPITEGGIQFVGARYCGPWTLGRRQDDVAGYKTMRFHMNGVKWPWITPDAHNEWVNSEKILYPAGTEGDTFLKAFNKAPVWTLEELHIFKEVFESFGIEVSRIPPSSSLSRDLMQF